jgi:hypothetical protein
MDTGIRTPIYVFGVTRDDVHVAATAEAALEHAVAHSGSSADLGDADFFDACGQPLAPPTAAGEGFTVLHPRAQLERRIRGMLSRHREGLAVASVPEPSRAVLTAFLEGSADLDALEAHLSAIPAHGELEHVKGSEPHNGSALHNLCHLFHLC